MPRKLFYSRTPADLRYHDRSHSMNYNISRASKRWISTVDLGCWWRPISVGWTLILKKEDGVLGRQIFFDVWIGLALVTFSLSIVSSERVRWEPYY